MIAYRFVITCADGLETALLSELDSFGIQGEKLKMGRILVTGDVQTLYQICLFSRVASRVLLPLGEYALPKDENGRQDIADMLYRFACGIDWTTVFGLYNTFAVKVSVDKRVSVNQQFATLRIKDAIADTFTDKLGSRPNVDKSPQFAIYVHIGVDSAELALDLSGTSLHRRGYRLHNTEAPLKENLAAALLYECGWHRGEFDTLIDPMCGSGTFAIEALLMWFLYPVGIDKAQGGFGFYHWQAHDESLWNDMTDKAMAQFYHHLEHKPLPALFLMDADLGAVKSAHKNILSSALTPVAKDITITHQPLANLPCIVQDLPPDSRPLLITNPPYGERLGDAQTIKSLYHGLGLIAKDALPAHSHLGVLASHIEMADVLPIVEPKTLKCHNGALSVYFRHGKVSIKDKLSLIEQFNKQTIDNPPAQEFINRLQKNLATLKKQAKKNNITNLRIYDADLPNFNVAIDLYGDKVHIQEYAPPKTIDTDVAKERFNLALMATRQVLGVNREDIFIKTRTKQAGNEQYTKQGTIGKRYVVCENGAYFYVNFTDYLDTGLFIDHRAMRARVGEASKNKHVLNLFAYTCSASVHCAMNGAKTVTSVDLSQNYLDWGRQNFVLNGLLLDERYSFVACDVFDWIKDNTDKFDVIFIDPPTFSNSKKFYGTFDVQRDHIALINRAMNRLISDGVVYFSNNFTKFVLDESLTVRYDVIEITHQTTGFDFKKGVHSSFEIRHKANKKLGVSYFKADDVFDDEHQKCGIKDKKLDDNRQKNPKHKKQSQVVNKPNKHYQSSGSPTKKLANTKQNLSNQPTIKKRYEKIDGVLQMVEVIEIASDTVSTKKGGNKQS